MGTSLQGGGIAVGGSGSTELGGTASNGGSVSTSGLGGAVTAIGGSVSGAGGVVTATAGSGGSEPGGAGAEGGLAGAGGSTTTALALQPNCDDRDPCTADSMDASGGCINATLADGTACDDGDICTAQDVCSGGVCSGSARESNAELLSILYSYGGFREDNLGLRSTSLVLEGNRIVFADSTGSGTVLSLVKVTEGGSLELLHQLISKRFLTTNTISMWLWFDLPNSAFFSLSADRFVLSNGGPTWAASVYDIVDNRIVERSTYAERIGTVSVSLVGKGERMWRQGSIGTTEFFVSPEGVISRGNSYDYPGITPCQMVLSPDGTTAYSALISGGQGIVRHDLSQTPPTKQFLWSGRGFVGVAANEQYLVTQEVSTELGTANISGLNVYRASDLSEVAAFPGDDANQPISFGLVKEGLLIEWQKNDGTLRRLVTQLYGLGGATPELLSEHSVWEDCCGSDKRLSPVHTKTFGALAVLAPFQRVLLIEDSGRVQRSVTGIGHGGLTQVAQAGAGLVSGFDNYSSQLIDLSTPREPRFVEGGVFATRQTQPVALYQSTSGTEVTLLPSRTNADADDGSPAAVRGISWLSALSGSRVSPKGSIALDDRGGYLFTQGSDLYELTQSGNSAYRIQRRRIDSQSNGQTSPVLSDYAVTVAGDDATPPLRTLAAADRFSRAIAIVDYRHPTSSSYVTSLYWLDEAERSLTLRASWVDSTSGTIPRAVATARKRVALLTDARLMVFELRGSQLELIAQRSVDTQSLSSDFEPDRLNDFDGSRLILGGLFAKRTQNLGVFDAETLQQVSGFWSGDVSSTVAEAGGNWIVGGDGAVTVLAPECHAQ